MSDMEVRVLGDFVDEQQSNIEPMTLNSASEEPASVHAAAQVIPASGSPPGGLQALIEAAGPPPHLIGALGPLSQHSPRRGIGTNSYVAKIQALIPGLQATGDEGRQLQAVIKISAILAMCDQGKLMYLPVKQLVSEFITLLGMKHNFDIMKRASYALTHIMEVLPRSLVDVVHAVPLLLEKLQVIQCVNLVGNSLNALVMLSRRYSYAILNERGVSTCLKYVDNFSIYAKRKAYSMIANCCLDLNGAEFLLIQDSLPLLASQLRQQDRKCVESVCLAFSNLVDCFAMEPARLQEIGSPELLTNLQQLLVVTPPLVSTSTIITVLRMLSDMCTNCPALSLALFKQNIAETLLYLLTGSNEFSQDYVELIPRQIGIAELITELLPELPSDGIFVVDVLLTRHSIIPKDQPVWQWKDNRGLWHVYSRVASSTIEAARLNGDDEISLNILGRTYTIDFNAMQQINEDTGTSRPIQNRLSLISVQSRLAEPAYFSSRPTSASRDARVACLRKERGLAAAFIRSLFSVLYEVYSSSGDSEVRGSSLKALVKMAYYASPELVKDVLQGEVVSSDIAGLMASSDLRIVFDALQMVEILMNKLPDEFGVHFRREGVIHQINLLADPEVPSGIGCSSTSFSSTLDESQPGSSHPPTSNTRTWLREQVVLLIETYFANEEDHRPATNIITRLKSAIENLATVNCAEALFDLREILIESYVSPFEINHSGLIRSLLNFLTNIDGPIDRDQRLRIMLNVFAGCPVDANVGSIEELNSACMSSLVAKLNRCVSQSEQFPINVPRALPASSGAGRGGTSVPEHNFLKFNLRRHPDCTNLKEWEDGAIRIHPLTPVQKIASILIERGYGPLCDQESAADCDESDSDGDIDDDDTLAGARHKLQLLIGNNVLPYNMTFNEVVRQFINNGNDQNVIYYRPLTKETSSAVQLSSSGTSLGHSSRKGKGSSNKSRSRRKNDDLWNGGITPPIHSPLAPFLISQLPDSVTIQDDSLEVLNLLRILNAMNLYWNALYPAVEYKPIITSNEFLNNNIAAKASRLLHDPLMITSGNLPNWLKQIASVCNFLLPFDTRHLLFYVTSFDRDRALKRLLDISPELSWKDSLRATPRFDKRKRTVSRLHILKHAEQVIQDFGTSKPLLEVQYENEIGTGPGPTLEFYALVSKELQKSCLDLWNSPDSSDLEYVNNPTGLFPNPLPRNAGVGQVTKARNKFRFMGKFMARAVMDFRILDLPFSTTFYRWLLGQQHCLTLADLQHVAPEIYITLRKMHAIVRKRDVILNDPNLTAGQKEKEVEKLEFDGCPINDLGIDFVLPGHHVELLKSGRSIDLTIHNLHLYVKLVTHWTLVEGVSRQMESLREGFDTVIPLQNLQLFQPDELESVFCGSSRDAIAGWNTYTLMQCCKPDHGYTCDSRAIRFLFEILSSYGKEEQRMFVQFLTGSPRLPVGGFKALSPPLTIVRECIEPNMDPDDFLPTVLTCVNYLKLPDYTSIEVMRQKLYLAASEGQQSFHIS